MKPLTVDQLRDLTGDALEKAKQLAATYEDMAAKNPNYKDLAAYHKGQRDTLQAIMNSLEPYDPYFDPNMTPEKWKAMGGHVVEDDEGVTA